MFQAIYALLRAWLGKQVLDVISKQVSSLAEQAPSRKEVSKQVSSTVKRTAESVEDITSDVSARVRRSAEKLSGQISTGVERSAEGISERLSGIRLLPRRRVKARWKRRTDWGAWMRLGLFASLVFWWLLIREQDDANRRVENTDEEGPPLSKVRSPSVTFPNLEEGRQAGAPAGSQAAAAQTSPSRASQEETTRSEAKGQGETGTQVDDLTRIEGIGPTIAALLRQNSIYTYQDLASADVSRLEGILIEANLRLADPGTWTQQARLAAAGDWDGLQEMQQGLRGGRRIEG